MKKLKLPLIDFSLQTSEGSFRNFKKKIVEVSEYLHQKEKSVGTNSTQFQDAYNVIKVGIIKHNRNIKEVVDTSIKIRALSKLLSETKIDITITDLKHIKTISSRTSLLLLSSITSYFFRYYDTLSQISRNELGMWLQNSYLERNKNISSNDKKLFSDEGIEWLLNIAKQTNRSLDYIITTENLDRYRDSRFYELLQINYYIEQLRALPVNTVSPLLDEVIKPKVYQAQYKKNQQLGHKILEILIDKVNDSVSDEWQKVVLKIAGDPRVPKDASNYRNWWLVLGEERISKVRGWLSKVDIKLFLATIQQYAEYKHNYVMLERYPKRKIFLDGLIKSKKVLETRLFLDPSIINTLKESGIIDEIPHYTPLVGYKDMAIIYMNLGNDVHIIEGSHQFAYRIYQNLSSNSEMYDYGLNSININTLRNLSSGRIITITHTENENQWQRTVISTLQSMGIDINLELVLSKSDYQNYKRRYGYYGY